MPSLATLTLLALSASSYVAASYDPLALFANIAKRQQLSQECQNTCAQFTTSLQNSCASVLPGIQSVIAGGSTPDLNSPQTKQILQCICKNEIIQQLTNCLACAPGTFGNVGSDALNQLSQVRTCR
ncbi:hypothetical protein EMMF5_004022 [Cystobasidiomycetes sp. EMM_F5]